MIRTIINAIPLRRCAICHKLGARRRMVGKFLINPGDNWFTACDRCVHVISEQAAAVAAEIEKKARG